MMNFIMLSCRKATELIEKQKVVGLSATEKIQLKVHVGMCKSCEKYKSDSAELDKHLEKVLRHEQNHISTENLQKTILHKIDHKK